MIEVGRKPPVFKLKNHNGENVRLSQFKGQWVVMYF